MQRSTPPQDQSAPGRAKQRAYAIAAMPDGDDLSEHREQPHPNQYLGQGKVEELRELVKQADANVVVADDELTPRQERNLEKALDVPVLDRTAVILDIFAGHAHTAEGKLQVELAQL